MIGRLDPVQMGQLNIRALEKLRKSRSKREGSSHVLVKRVWVEYIGADGILRRHRLQVHNNEPRNIFDSAVDIIEKGRGYVIYCLASNRKHIYIFLYGNHDERTVKMAYNKYLAMTGGGKILEVRFEVQRERR